MTTGARMKMRRKELGVPVDRVAAALGVSVATVYRYEKGDIEKVPGALLEPLARVLQTTAAWLMGWSDDVNTSKEKGVTVGSRVKPFVSNKGVRLVCKIDSKLYNELADFADINGRTLEDEIEIRLHDSLEMTWDTHDCEDNRREP